MFNFTAVNIDTNKPSIDARCQLDPSLSFFKGHFEGKPILPAVAQLRLIETLIDKNTQWGYKLHGGKALKFIQPILPNDEIRLRLLVNKEQTSISFTIDNNGQLASKGTLYISGGNIA